MKGFQSNSTNSLPYPFNLLDVRRSKGSSSECHIFSALPNGEFSGYRFPSGYRLMNSLKKDDCDSVFFIECRNITKKKRGFLAAMIPRNGPEGCRHIKDPRLVLVQGIVRCPVTEDYYLSVHIWKDGQRLDSFANLPDGHQLSRDHLTRYFDVGINIAIETVKLVYLNAILGNKFLLHPSFRSSTILNKLLQQKQLPSHVPSYIECSLESCDVWYHRLFRGFNSLSVHNSCKRFRYLKSENPAYNHGSYNKLLPWLSQDEETHLYAVTTEFRQSRLALCLDSTSGGNSDAYFLVPFKFFSEDETMAFAPIHQKDLAMLQNNGPMSAVKFRSSLQHYMKKRNTNLLKVIRIIPLDCESFLAKKKFGKKVDDHQGHGGNIVCFIEDPSQFKFKDAQPTTIHGIHKVVLTRNVDDTFLGSMGCSTVFRGYQWPYKTQIDDDVFELLSRTYKRKGLVRGSVPHQGNFEMIGSRTSCQSTGSMVALPKNTVNHEYYRASMDASLLPLVRGVINSLQEEALTSNYTSGESIMPLLLKKNESSNVYKSLCPQTIITQGHFCNAVHFDDCFADSDLIQAIKDDDTLSQDKCPLINNIQKHVKVKEKDNGKFNLPKSTTCCWTLRKACNRTVMQQFFVGVSAGFAFDISSPVTSNLGSVGATFQSSLFDHCTSVPIWIDQKTSLIHWKAPYENKNYNFAWGSNGKKNK